MSTSFSEALLRIKGGFLILGLTGFTGSGCSTSARILSRSEGPNIKSFSSTEAVDSFEFEIERLVHQRLTTFWKRVDWKPFINIQISKVIFALSVLEAIKNPENDRVISNLIEPIKDKLDGLKYLKEDNGRLTLEQSTKLIESYKLLDDLYSPYKNKSTSNLEEFIQRMQVLGDNIRQYGVPIYDRQHPPKQQPSNLLILPEAVRRVIRAYRYQGESHFVIDAFRNPYEVEYFRRRYNEFYLVALNRDPLLRKKSLLSAKLSNEFIINKLDKREKGEVFKDVGEKIASLDLNECIRRADVYIDNIESDDSSRTHLEHQLARLVTLTKYPGSLPPTNDERCMQIAMTARQASGCISRRVGAVVVDKKGYVAGIGWNDPPYNQIPCSLRTVRDLELNQETDKESESKFSKYERSDLFKNPVISRYKNNNEVPFCFKDELSKNEERDKRAEFTRSLHGEENAFLQASRMTGEILDGGTLYTTDRTCNLCAKKAYQLEIKRIVFVEDYTDIAIDQTLDTGHKIPRIERFQGILGAAYFKLFASLMPEKDLIALENLQQAI